MSGEKATKASVTLGTEELWSLFDLASEEDIFDTSRWGDYHNALFQTCIALEEAGLGDRKTMGMTRTTASKFIKFIEDGLADE